MAGSPHYRQSRQEEGGRPDRAPCTALLPSDASCSNQEAPTRNRCSPTPPPPSKYGSVFRCDAACRTVAAEKVILHQQMRRPITFTRCMACSGEMRG